MYTWYPAILRLSNISIFNFGARESGCWSFHLMPIQLISIQQKVSIKTGSVALSERFQLILRTPILQLFLPH